MTPQEIDAITLRVYLRRLDDNWNGDAEMALKRDGAVKMQRRANIWKPLITAVLMELGLHEKQRGPRQEGFEKELNAYPSSDDAAEDEAIDA